MECFCKTKLHSRSLRNFSGISKPCKTEFVSLQFTENFQTFFKYLRKIWLRVLQPVDCKLVTLINKKLLEIPRSTTLWN